MAKVQLTNEVLKAAIAAYTKDKGMEFSEGEHGGLKAFVIMPGDHTVYIEDEKLICSDTPTWEALSMRIVDSAAESSRIEDKPPRGMNVPARTQKPGVGPLVKSGIAVRDIQVAELTFDDIRNYICPDANDQETMIFLKLCQARNLNPFLRDVYLIKYDKTKPAQMVVGKDAFTKKAEDHPKFDGYKAGIIVKNPDSLNGLDYREGTFLLKGEELLGGWAEVYRTDRKATPYKMAVSMKEYSTGKSNWDLKPATMIRKVALVQALREAFPSEFSGMYDQDEIGIDPSKEVGQ